MAISFPTSPFAMAASAWMIFMNVAAQEAVIMIMSVTLQVSIQLATIWAALRAFNSSLKRQRIL
jgi:hypothetical protein